MIILRKSFLALLCLLTIALLQSTSRADQAGPVARLTSQQATRLADAFCKRMNFRVGQKSVAEFPIPKQFPDEEDTYWQPCWRIDYDTNYTVYIVDSSGLVLGYADKSFPLSSGYRHRVPVDTDADLITEVQAVERATAVLNIMGWKNIKDQNTWFLKSARLLQTTEDRDHDTWSLVWYRLYQEIPCRDECITASVHAYTGEVANAFSSGTVPPFQPLLARPLLAINMQQAAQIAAKHLAGVQIAAPELMDIETEILRPDDTFQAGGRGQNKAKWVRSVWNCHFEFMHPKYGPCMVDVHVDTQTGQVIGGSFGQRHGAKPVIAPAQVLQTAKEVRVYRRCKTGSWPNMPILVLNTKTQPDTLRQLQQVSTFGKDPHLPLGDIKLIAVGADTSLTEFNYDPLNGRLMQNGQSSILPQTLIVQLKNMVIPPTRVTKK